MTLVTALGDCRHSLDGRSVVGGSHFRTRSGCWFSSIVPQWASDHARRSEQMARQEETLARAFNRSEFGPRRQSKKSTRCPTPA